MSLIDELKKLNITSEMMDELVLKVAVEIAGSVCNAGMEGQLKFLNLCQIPDEVILAYLKGDTENCNCEKCQANRGDPSDPLN